MFHSYLHLPGKKKKHVLVLFFFYYFAVYPDVFSFFLNNSSINTFFYFNIIGICQGTKIKEEVLQTQSFNNLKTCFWSLKGHCVRVRFSSVCISNQCGSGWGIKDSGNHTLHQPVPSWTLPSLLGKHLSLSLWARGQPTKLIWRRWFRSILSQSTNGKFAVRM